MLSAQLMKIMALILFQELWGNFPYNMMTPYLEKIPQTGHFPFRVAQQSVTTSEARPESNIPSQCCPTGKESKAESNEKQLMDPWALFTLGSPWNSQPLHESGDGHFSHFTTQEARPWTWPEAQLKGNLTWSKTHNQWSTIEIFLLPGLLTWAKVGIISTLVGSLLNIRHDASWYSCDWIWVQSQSRPVLAKVTFPF